MAVRREFVEGLYNELLNRGGAPHEVEGWMNASDENAVRQAFMGSPEYASIHGTAPTWQDVGGQITPIAPAAAPNYTGYDGAPTSTSTSASTGSAPFNPTTADWNRMHGFAANNYYDPNMQTMKYQFARIAADYDPAQAGARDRMMQDPRFRAAFPNARAVGKDSIDFGGQLSEGGGRGVPVGIVDVGEQFIDNGSGRAWQWLDQGNMGAGGGSGIPGGATTRRPSDLMALGQMFGGPGGPGITNGPLQQIGQDPLSLLITGALADLIQRGGSTDFGDFVQQALTDYMQGSGSMNKRYESARELADKGRRTMINDARASLADRGLLSEPGAPSGVEAGVLRSINADVSQEFARTVRDIAADQDDRILPVLQMATSLSQSQAANLLASIGEGTSRQTALAQIALQQLGQNMAWNQFLAEFGLKRDQALSMLQNGQSDDLMQLMNLFLSMGSLLRGGYV